jgi:hypothetical protein
MNRKIIISMAILTAICCLGVSVISTGLFFVSQSSLNRSDSEMYVEPAKATEESAPTRPAPLDTPIPSDPSNSERAATAAIPSEWAAQMDSIQRQIVTLRGLQPMNPVPRALLTQSELQQKVETEFFMDYSEQDARDDALILSILGLLPRDYDLIDLYTRLYTEQIAGYYDSETKEMYVVRGQTFGGIERMTYAHEYTHILQDQTYDLQNGLKINTENCRVETEYCSAVTALLEGDAVYTEQQWMLNFASGADRDELQTFSTSYSSPVFDSAPQYMQDDFLFPYKKGLEFVYSLNDRGGYALVDQALEDPPVSTEQILHPDKYPADKPVEITLPDLSTILPGKWQKVEENVLGEWFSFLVLSDGLGEDYQLPAGTARTATAGWGGDRYMVYSNSDNDSVVFLLQCRWDTENDAREFFNALRQYGLGRWGTAHTNGDGQVGWDATPEGSVYVSVTGLDTLWLITPSLEEQDSVLSALPIFNFSD